jgi:hypothetical protein
MDITIPVQRKRIPVVLIAALILSVLLGLNLSYLKRSYDGVLNIFVFAWLFVIVLFYAIIGLIAYLKNVFDKSASLVITEKGIKDTLALFSCGEISWAEIEDVILLNKLGAVLVIKLKDPDAVISRQTGWKRFFSRKMFKKMGSPVIISQRTIDYNIEELKNIILQHKQ